VEPSQHSMRPWCGTWSLLSCCVVMFHVVLLEPGRHITFDGRCVMS
jgi:hypothetical protein